MLYDGFSWLANLGKAIRPSSYARVEEIHEVYYAYGIFDVDLLKCRRWFAPTKQP